MESKLRISGVIDESIVDGPGIRYVVFTQGCPHHCTGCHNPQTHDFNGGRIVDIQQIIEEIKNDPLISGVTLSGGEPFCQPKPLINLAKKAKEIGKNIMAYSGYTFEEILKDKEKKELLSLCDILVDGKFILEQKSLMLHFRGSKNQRLIDVQKSLSENKVVIIDR